MRLRIVLVILGMVAAIGVSAAPAQALLKVKCDDPVGIAAVDPILHHNETNAMVHQHQFFGNADWLPAGNFANPTDLLSKDTDCREGLDTAGYWTPTLVYTSGAKKGQVVPSQQFTAYYRPFWGIGGPDVGPGEPIPTDTRLVSEMGESNWTCGMNSGSRSRPLTTIPDCTGLSGRPGLTLTAHIDFPSCWDGVLPDHRTKDVGDTTDNEHWAYPDGNGNRATCPSGFPNKMVALRETIQFAYQGDGGDVALSSDLMMGKDDGSTLHGDFWNTWDPAGLSTLTDLCVNSNGPDSVCDK